MPETNHKPDGKWVVQAVDHKFREMDENATPRRWRSFSPDMWAMYVGWIRALQQWAVWEDYNDTVADVLPLYALEEEPPETECPDCPPEPEPPKPTPGQGAGKPGQTVGALGLSIEELEGLLMGSIMDIRISGGLLQVQYFPCCDWITIGDIAGIAENAAATPPSTLQAAFDSGALSGILTQPALTPVQAGFDNPNTLRCVKATAIKYALQTFLVDIRDYVDESVNDLAIIIGGLAAAIALFVPPLRTLISVNLLGNIIKKFGKEAFVDGVNEFLADTEFWEEFVCSTTEDFESTESVTGLDLSNFYSYMTQTVLGVSEVVLELVSKMSPTDFQRSINYYIGSVGCECSDYLPAGYVPPSAAGAISFVELAYSMTNTSTAPFGGLNGLPDEGLPRSPDQGVIVSGTSWRTTYTGQDFDSGEPNKYTQLCILLTMPEETTIDQFTFDMDVVGAVTGAGIVHLVVQMAVLTMADVWQVNTNSGYTLEDATGLVYDQTSITGTKMVIVFKTRNENINLYSVISNLLFTGNRDGAGFLNVPIGQALP
jgi:hypothetical protein